MYSVVNEEWRAVPDAEGFSVSNLGRVIGPRGRQLRLIAKRSGHLVFGVPLADGSGRKREYKVHRAVLRAFAGEPLPGHVRRHLNGIPNDNSLTNLAWGTPLDNSADAIRHGTRPCGAAHYASKLSKDDVLTIRFRRAAGETARSIANDYPVGLNHIYAVARGAKWKEKK